MSLDKSKKKTIIVVGEKNQRPNKVILNLFQDLNRFLKQSKVEMLSRNTSA